MKFTAVFLAATLALFATTEAASPYHHGKAPSKYGKRPTPPPSKYGRPTPPPSKYGKRPTPPPSKYHHGKAPSKYGKRPTPPPPSKYGKRPTPRPKYVRSKSLSIASAPLAASVPFTVCSGADALVDVKNLQFEPAVPSKKSPFTVMSWGHVKKEVQVGAKILVEAFIGSAKVLSETYDVCNTNTKCPVAVGEGTLASTVPVPAQLPPFVTVRVQARATNPDGAELFCISTNVKFIP